MKAVTPPPPSFVPRMCMGFFPQCFPISPECNPFHQNSYIFFFPAGMSSQQHFKTSSMSCQYLVLRPVTTREISEHYETCWINQYSLMWDFRMGKRSHRSSASSSYCNFSFSFQSLVTQNISICLSFPFQFLIVHISLIVKVRFVFVWFSLWRWFSCFEIERVWRLGTRNVRL